MLFAHRRFAVRLRAVKRFPVKIVLNSVYHSPHATLLSRVIMARSANHGKLELVRVSVVRIDRRDLTAVHSVAIEANMSADL
jgi:hypothetical protein